MPARDDRDMDEKALRELTDVIMLVVDRFAELERLLSRRGFKRRD